MTAKQIVDMAVAYCGITKTELARRIDWSPQLLSKRLTTGKLSVEEWERIAAAIGAHARIGFIFPDGKEI